MTRFPVTRILYSCLSFACFLCLAVSSIAQADKAPLPIVTGDGETTTLDGLLVKYTVQVDDGPIMGMTAQFFDDQLNMVVILSMSCRAGRRSIAKTAERNATNGWC